MAAVELGVLVDHLQLPVKEGLRRAAEMGFAAVELMATSPQVNPEVLGRTGQRHLARYVRDLGLRLAALGADLGAAGLGEPAAAEYRLDTLRRILELAAGLGVPVVTTRLGSVAEDVADAQRALIVEGTRALAEHADLTGTIVAAQTGSERPERLAAFLKQIDCPHVRVCYDTGAVLMRGDDPIGGVEALAEFVVLSHLRDATRGRPEQAGQEVAIGQGELDLAAYLGALEEAGYRGPQIVVRSQSERPLAEIALAKARLDALLR